jgi:hypothetical protein
LTIGLLRLLDQAFGYPPAIVIENFQQRLKAIKAIDEYSQLMEAIKLNDVIKSPDDMIDFVISSIEISNLQGYTRIPSPVGERNRRYLSTDDDEYSSKRQKR